MILDARAVFADAQESTVNVASTDIIDTVAAGDSYTGAWFVTRIDTAVSGGAGTATKTFQLQTSSSSTFTGGAGVDLTLIQSAAYVKTYLTAGKFFAARIPPGAKRYLRGYQVSTGSGGGDFFTAGKFDMFITNDIDIEINKRYLLLNP